jgi:hypothetical protein
MRCVVCHWDNSKRSSWSADLTLCVDAPS